MADLEGKQAMRIVPWLKGGYELVVSELPLMLLLMFIYTVLLGSVGFITKQVFGAGYLVIYGPLTCGLFFALFEKMRKGRIDIGDLFKGFEFFLPTFLLGLLVGLFSLIGGALCILPGIVVGAMYMFAFPLVMEKKMDFWPAMELSRKKVFENPLEFILFYLLVIGITFIGLLGCVVGVVFTSAVGFSAMAVAYKEVFGLEGVS